MGLVRGMTSRCIDRDSWFCDDFVPQKNYSFHMYELSGPEMAPLSVKLDHWLELQKQDSINKSNANDTSLVTNGI